MSIILKFVIIVSGIILTTAAGYFARRKNLLDEKYAGDILLYTVIFGWAPSSVFVLWKLKLSASLIALPILSIILPLTLLPIAIVIADKIYHLQPKTAGTFIIAAMISNIGFTMGGFVCYCMFGMQGLGYAQLYCASWTIPIIGFGYLIARKFGQPDEPFDWRFVLRTFTDRRSLPILGTLIGLVLNLTKTPPIMFIYEYHIVDILVLSSVMLSFFIIGLQLHFSTITDEKRLHILLALMKFIISPIIMLLMLAIMERFSIVLPMLAKKVAIIESAVPTAVFTVIIANLFHLRPKLAGMLFIVNTIVFLVFVLPVIVFLLG